VQTFVCFIDIKLSFHSYLTKVVHKAKQKLVEGQETKQFRRADIQITIQHPTK